jgi:hypothetical protein
MARIGISITKSCPFRNSVQEFSNVYYYSNGAGVLPDQPTAASLIDELVTDEKTWHSSGVTFVRGRCWSQVGTPAGNEMIDQHNLSGVGSMTTVASFDKERAYLFRLRAGNDSRGNPVYLRKWYHSCGLFDTGLTPSSAILENASGWSSANRTQMANKMDTIRRIGASGVWQLCSKNGRTEGTGQTFEAHQFLEHHQLGDMWRAQ